MSRVQRIAIVAGVLVAAGAIPFVVDVVDSPSVSLASEEGGASGVAGPRHEPRRGPEARATRERPR